MSEEHKDVSLLAQMKQQHEGYCHQKSHSETNIQQLIGAIYALEQLIKNYEEQLKKTPGLSQEDLGDQGNGETHEQTESEVTQE